VILESAVTAIMDCEDSVACVDAEDKTLAYRNWLGLMKGDLEEELRQGRQDFIRSLNGDRIYRAGRQGRDAEGPLADAGPQCRPPDDQPGDPRWDGNEIPEGLMDAMMTTLIALHDLGPTAGRANSVTGSVYVVKPKMHGPEEVAFADEIFGRSRQLSGWRPTRQAGHHGRGAAHHGQPQGMHPRGEAPGCVHQHRVPRPDRRRDPHLDGSRPDDPQGFHQAEGRLDRRL
jgi:malate synthase